MSNKFNTSNFSNFEIFNDENLSHTIHRFVPFEEDKMTLKAAEILTNTETVLVKNWKNSIWSETDNMPKTFVSEAGMYAMIMGAQVEKALLFRYWITHTVIPSIREHGGYIMGQEHIEDKEDQNLLLTRVEDLTEQVDMSFQTSRFSMTKISAL